ncbi:MAG TPA: CHAT domain-containing protein [Acidothermaceae bacterium]|jgi:tetratricopeptide (TPR) repeat protein
MSVTKDPELTQLQRRAEAVYAQVPVAPARAEATARQLIAEAASDPTAQVIAMRALALTVRLSAGPNESIKIVRAAVRLGERHHLGRCLAEARMTYAALLADMGRMTAALTECDRAAEVLKGKDAGPLLAHRALILARAGRSEEAMSNFARALPLLRAANDIHFQCLVFINRSNLLAYLGRLGAAERDLQSGITLARTHGLHQRLVILSANLGFLKARGGDIPAALRLFADAIEGAGKAPGLVATHDRAEALLIAGMPGEARESLERRVDDVERAGFAVDLAEWHLLLAQAALMEGEVEVARAPARRALTEFRAQGRARWALLAQQLVIRARWASGERTTALARAARAAHAKLWTAGWQVAALHCLVVAGRIELEAGRLAAARTDLAQAAQARRRGPADLRAAAWYAEAMLRLASHDTRGATTALKAGLRVVDDHAASLGATDLRVHATGLGTDLAEQGVRLAVQSSKPVAVLEWIERFRAGTLRRRPVRPPSDARLAGELADLRRVTAELAQTTADGDDSRGLRAEQLRLEEVVRQRSRHARGTRTALREFDVSELRTAVGDRALVEILRVDDAMLAVTVVDGKLRLHELGSYPDSLRELESLRFSLHRLARKHGSAASLAAARLGLSHAAEALDALLIQPVLDVIGDREVVVVPTGQLHALPWPTLPSLRGRPVCVAPSATTWLAAMRANTRSRVGRRVVLVAGPNLEHSEPEVAALAKLYGAPQMFTGSDASADVVRQSIDGAELVHIAAHGRFRADNPQFSAIELADGLLTVYDLERMHRGPRRLVLSACDTGLSAVHAGDELMGLVGAVFSLGTSTLIASVVPVADDLTESLMVELHHELCAGASPAHALATAQTRVQVDGFVCFGAA